MTTKRPLHIKMRVVLHVGKLLVIILVVWLLALIFLTGSLHRNNDSEETLAKKLIEAQSETLSYKRELGNSQKKSKYINNKVKTIIQCYYRTVKEKYQREWEYRVKTWFDTCKRAHSRVRKLQTSSLQGCSGNVVLCPIQTGVT